jgi:hypothetical protein
MPDTIFAMIRCKFPSNVPLAAMQPLGSTG